MNKENKVVLFTAVVTMLEFVWMFAYILSAFGESRFEWWAFPTMLTLTFATIGLLGIINFNFASKVFDK